MEPPIADQQTPVNQPIPTQQAPHPKKKKMILIILALVLGFFIIGVIGYFLGTQTTKGHQQPTPTISPLSPTSTVYTTPAPTKAISISPTDSGIPITANTVSFTRVNTAIYLRYKGHVYSEEAANKNDTTLTNLANPDQYTWYGLVDAPEIPADIAGFDELFDFKAFPNKANFVFIMRWPVTATKTNYNAYYYDTYLPGNKVSLLYTSTQGGNGNEYTVPRVNQISPEGNAIAFNLFACWNCGGHAPEVMLLNIQTKQTKKIGKVSSFNWLSDGKYEYTEYKVIPCASDGPGECSEDPATLPKLTGTF